MTAGLVTPPQEDGYRTAAREDSRSGTYRRLVFRNDTLVGMTLVNAIEQGGVLTALIQNRIPVRGPRERLLAPHFNYRAVA
jgi:NAD(P)H-nitrite reductase large subunit